MQGIRGPVPRPPGKRIKTVSPNDRKKVLWLIKGLGLGGAEKLLALSLPYVDLNRFDYEVAYLLPWKTALVKDFEAAGLRVTCLDQGKPYDLRVLPRLVRLLREHRVDVLHMHLPYSAIIGRIASRFAPVRSVVYTEHNVWERYRWPTSTLNRLTYGWNDAVIAVSGSVERSISSRYRANGRPKLAVIPNGIDLDELLAVPREPAAVRAEFGIPQSHSLVVHVANFTPKKRHEDLLEAAQLVLEREPSVTFLLVGQGPLESAMKERARELGLADRVVFAGFRPDATRLVAGADVFVLSSLYEGLPVSLLEAMAVGTAVVTTEVGGIGEAITDGVEGLLVKPGRPDQLADGIVDLLRDPELRQRLAAHARKRVEREFDVRTMVQRVEAVYHDVLS